MNKNIMGKDEWIKNNINEEDIIFLYDSGDCDNFYCDIGCDSRGFLENSADDCDYHSKELGVCIDGEEIKLDELYHSQVLDDLALIKRYEDNGNIF